LTGGFVASYAVVGGHAVKLLLMSPVRGDCVGNVLRMSPLAPAPPRPRPKD
jgi:hypothetical protein